MRVRVRVCVSALHSASLTFSTPVNSSIHSSVVLWSQISFRALFSVLLTVSSCELPHATLKSAQYFVTSSFISSSVNRSDALFSSAMFSSLTECWLRQSTYDETISIMSDSYIHFEIDVMASGPSHFVNRLKGLPNFEGII